MWTILHPDETTDLTKYLDDSTSNDGLAERVRKRNELLLLAWKKFWFVVVSRDQRGNETALRLGLDFATLVRKPHPPLTFLEKD